VGAVATASTSARGADELQLLAAQKAAPLLRLDGHFAGAGGAISDEAGGVRAHLAEVGDESDK